MIEKLKSELRKELSYLNKWIRTTETGGWSTQNLDDMKKRRDELKVFLYDIDNKPSEWCKS